MIESSSSFQLFLPLNAYNLVGFVFGISLERASNYLIQLVLVHLVKLTLN